MKVLTTSLFFIISTIYGYAQCSSLGVQVSSSTTTSVNLYHAGFFLIPNGNDNVIDWLITDASGTLIHQTTTSGAWADQSFMLFNHSIPTTEMMNVSITITNATAGIVCIIEDALEWQGNWVVVNGNTGILPVELLSLKGKAEDNHISLSWETAVEVNNYGFEIQRSTDNKSWETIGFEPGQGNSTQLNQYQSNDESPNPGINYYRLKQLDYDGQKDYSKAIVVTYRNTKSTLLVFPNPSSGDINIAFTNTDLKALEIRINDVQGRLIWQTTVSPEGQSYNQKIRLETNGLYVITTKMGNQINQEKLIIQL